MTDKQDTPRVDAPTLADELPLLLLYEGDAPGYVQETLERAANELRELTALRASIEAAEMPEEPNSWIPELPANTLRTGPARKVVYKSDYDALRAQLAAVTVESDEAEELHRMQLTAISVIALCNTTDSLEKQRIGKDNPYWTPAFEDTVSAVGREMRERERATEAEAKLAAERKDAERYRKMRDEIVECNAGADMPNWCDAVMRADVDAAIDRALTGDK